MNSWSSFLGVIALLACNRLVLALAGDGTRAGLFWSVQLLNLAAACALFSVGLPGVPTGLGIINYFVGGVFLLHIVENNANRTRVLQKRLASSAAVSDERRTELLAKLRAARAADAEEREDSEEVEGAGAVSDD